MHTVFDQDWWKRDQMALQTSLFFLKDNAEHSESAEVLPVVNACRTRWSVQKALRSLEMYRGWMTPEVLGVLYLEYAVVQQQLQRRSADMLFSLSRSRERLAMHMLRVLLEVYHRRCSQIDIYLTAVVPHEVHIRIGQLLRGSKACEDIRIMVKRPVLSDTRVSYVI